MQTEGGAKRICQLLQLVRSLGPLNDFLYMWQRPLLAQEFYLTRVKPHRGGRLPDFLRVG